ncbi:MAG TPA: hypothetical protein VN819_02105 [Thermoplasmata archaeon]|nr:hypothetical protein [Thermoplasmata archaeon]
MTRTKRLPKDRTTRILEYSFGATLVLIAVATMGLASASGWFTNQNTVTQGGTAGTTELTWNNPYNTTSNSYVVCHAGGTHGTDLSSVLANNLGPGDYCVASAMLKNFGTLPLVLGETTVSWSYNPACFWYANNVANAKALTVGPAMNGVTYSFPVVANNSIALAPGATFHFELGVGIWAAAPEACQGQVASYVINVYGLTPGGNGP